MINVSKLPEESEWNEWKQHPCTKALVSWMIEERQSMMERWATGQFSAAFTMEMAVKNAGATGACSVLEDLKDLDYNQIVIKGESSGESVGPDTVG